MTKTLQAALCLALILAWAGAAHGQTAWQKVAPAEGRFTVFMPGSPEIDEKTESTPVGGIIEKFYTVHVGDESFIANYQDLPQLALMLAGGNRIYNDARNGFLKDWSATQTAWSHFTVGKREGRELVWTAAATSSKPPLSGRVHFFLVGRRLYVLITAWPQSGSPADADAFLASFRLVE